MESVTSIYGSYVFDDRVMRVRLPKDTYDALVATISLGKDIDLATANIVAKTMKEWAIELGATHFTHWFQPMTGATAEKHDSFISPQGDGSVIMEFSGKELIKGEPDASSFPSGGLRATFEARGYTAWDPTSFAFVKEKTLFIPTAFCSYGGAALDMKTPLLKSMEVLNTQAMRILKLFGSDATHVDAQVGLEQEYFLIDKTLYERRKDLRFCGRTLLGAKPPKGQELDDHYFGAIKPRVADFMHDLDTQLWKYGVPAKTEHNESAPAQHELASIYSNVNLAIDRNLLIMDTMNKTADKHGMACLLHEKPFEGINGSAKHNNWSLMTNTGVNLFDPKNGRLFILFLMAVIAATDRHQDLLTASISTPSNDRRLGGSEAPPSTVSIFLGDDITGLLDSFTDHIDAKMLGKKKMGLGVKVIPSFPKDTADRNRTSPVAFTGNKFEFRMVGSQLNASEPNIVINASVAETLSEFADRLEKAEDFDLELINLTRETWDAHKRIVFNGNNYSDEWKKEAQKRGLATVSSTADAIKAIIKPENVHFFEKLGIFSKTELESRFHIVNQHYSKSINIEANTMLEMLKTDVIPVAIEYTGMAADSINAKKKISMAFNCLAETKLLEKIEHLLSSLISKVPLLEQSLEEAAAIADESEKALFYSNGILPLMEELRRLSDNLELSVGRKFWPFPTNEELLFSI